MRIYSNRTPKFEVFCCFTRFCVCTSGMFRQNRPLVTWVEFTVGKAVFTAAVNSISAAVNILKKR